MLLFGELTFGDLTLSEMTFGEIAFGETPGNCSLCWAGWEIVSQPTDGLIWNEVDSLTKHTYHRRHASISQTTADESIRN